MPKISNKLRYLLCACMLLALAGCSNPFSSSQQAARPDPYYGEFNDVPIPSAMDPDSGNTAVTYAPGGLKTGMQLYKGRVEVGSLAAVMGTHMTRDGWTLRSALRSTHTILVFDKPDRFCTIYIYDGFSTEMRIFVTAKLQQGDATFRPPVAAPVAPAQAPAGSSGGGVEVYQPGGFSQSN